MSTRPSLTDLCFLVGTAFYNAGVPAVLTGGSAAEIYSDASYHSDDADFVIGFGATDSAKSVLINLGFVATANPRVFKHEDYRYTVELLPGSINVGSSVVTEFHTLHREDERVTLLTATDAVRDRLCSYYFWNERSGLRAALQIAQSNPTKIDLDMLRTWSEAESQGPFGSSVPARFEEFLHLFYLEQNRAPREKDRSHSQRRRR